ncbi:hypothetical protein O181_044339 [Austropuccinia psidii MF-1]|uniref:Uncharacterized protein n=1 Tax=Austropuccinia psidii MF-1 TaxID=1389203 RepID=A0A9Q3HJB2_9BASI|nr:hypothetical protein [Austropuccinia psidii MF-1]
MDKSYYQEYIKPDSFLENKARPPSQYQDGDSMSYSGKEALKQLPEASSWPEFSGAGEYDNMKLIDYIDRLFIDVPRIPDYWITARLNTAFKGHASICYTEMKEIHGRRNWPWWKSQITQKYNNGESLETNPEREAEVAKKKNSYHNCGYTDHYANNFPKAKKKVYAIEKVPENSELCSMVDAIREQYDEEKDPREEFLVEYQEETPLEIQDIQLEAGMPQDTANQSLCKHMQDAQTFLVTPTKGMAYIHRTATKITVCIDNAQHPFIIGSGALCFIVARNYLDNRFPIGKRSSCQPIQRASKVLQGR